MSNFEMERQKMGKQIVAILRRMPLMEIETPAMQRDLFRSPFHCIFVMRNGEPSPVLHFQKKDEMRRVAIYKMKKDGAKIAYCQLCAWTGNKVQSLEIIYYGDKCIR